MPGWRKFNFSTTNFGFGTWGNIRNTGIRVHTLINIVVGIDIDTLALWLLTLGGSLLSESKSKHVNLLEVSTFASNVAFSSAKFKLLLHAFFLVLPRTVANSLSKSCAGIFSKFLCEMGRLTVLLKLPVVSWGGWNLQLKSSCHSAGLRWRAKPLNFWVTASRHCWWLEDGWSGDVSIPVWLESSLSTIKAAATHP